jgi:hypothetical protein
MQRRGNTLVAHGRDVRRLEKAPPVQFQAAVLHCLRSHNAAGEEDRNPPETAEPPAARLEDHSFVQ